MFHSITVTQRKSSRAFVKFGVVLLSTCLLVIKDLSSEQNKGLSFKHKKPSDSFRSNVLIVTGNQFTLTVSAPILIINHYQMSKCIQ